MKKVFSMTNIAIGLMCLILGLALTWQYSSVKKNQQNAQVENMKLSELQTALLNEKYNNDSLKTRLAELQKENDKIKNEENIGKQLQSDLERAKKLAGLLAVKGEGVVVKLEQNKKNFEVVDTNVLDVVNELRAAGAEAISINDERVVATTEISQAGSYVMINGVRMKGTFTINAIGNRKQLYASLNLLGGVVDLLKSDIGVKLTEQDEISIPAVRDDNTVLREKFMKVVTK